MIQPSTYSHFVVFLFGFFNTLSYTSKWVHLGTMQPVTRLVTFQIPEFQGKWWWDGSESHKTPHFPSTKFTLGIQLSTRFYSMQKYIDNRVAKVEEVSSRTDRDYWSVGCPVWQCRWLHVGGSRKQRGCSKLIVQAMWRFPGSQLWASPIKLLTDQSPH